MSRKPEKKARGSVPQELSLSPSPPKDGDKLRRDTELAVTCHTEFTVPGEAVPKGRPRFNRKTQNFYTPTPTKVYEECVALLAKATGTRYNKGVTLYVEVTLYTQKNSPPDCDNCLKSLLDGMQTGGLLENDSQVWEFHVKRVRSANPRVHVSVFPIQVESEQ